MAVRLRDRDNSCRRYTVKLEGTSRSVSLLFFLWRPGWLSDARIGEILKFDVLFERRERATCARSDTPAFCGEVTRLTDARQSVLQASVAILPLQAIPTVGRCGYLMPRGRPNKKD